MKEFTVKESEGFRFRVKSWKCLSPAELNTLEFIRESLNEDGKVIDTSISQLFMTDSEIKILCEGMLA